MVNFTILAGGYTSFVASYVFNTDASSLTLLNNSTTGENPSWITLHPTNKSILYAVNENDDGALQSYTVGDGGILTGPVDTIASGGSSPAFTVPLSNGEVAIMNYGSGNGKILPTTSDPLHFSDSAVITFPPPDGGVSHLHEAVEYNGEVLVPDLGGNKIWRLQNGTDGNWSIKGEIDQPQGSGPRHIALHSDVLYTLHELSSTLTAQAFPKDLNDTSLNFISNSSTLPPTQPKGAAFAAGEILIPPTSDKFPDSIIYTSNRNTGTQDPNGDTIVLWSIKEDGSFEQIKQVYTGLDQIRGMEFSTEVDGGMGEYLVAGGVAGEAGVQVWQRVDGGKDLKLVVNNTEVPTRTSFVWLN